MSEPGYLDTNVRSEINGRHEEISALLAMTRAARDDAARLGLKFEAYLLDMAALALFEQWQKTSSV